MAQFGRRARQRHDRSVAMCMDAAGNVAITGYSISATKFDYVTVKYGTNSNQLWKKAMDGDAQGADAAFAIACDTTGNTYVTGKSWNGTNYDYLTVKYNGTGGEQWRQHLPADSTLSRTAFAIVVDASGNVTVSGSENHNSLPSGPSNPQRATVRYDSNGNQLWALPTVLDGSGGGADVYTALATDGAGNIYTSGFGINGANNELLVIKYSRPAPRSGALM